jgi:hypothetical protein
MSIQKENEINTTVDKALDDFILNLQDKYPEAFQSWGPRDSPVGITEKTFNTQKAIFGDVLKAAIRWPFWLKGE